MGYPITLVHVALLYVIGPASQQVSTSRKATWSETMPNPGTTTQAAPFTTGGQQPNFGAPCFEIDSPFPIWVAIGPNPDASQASGAGQTGRVRVNGLRRFYADEGDKLAWIAA